MKRLAALMMLVMILMLAGAALAQTATPTATLTPTLKASTPTTTPTISAPRGRALTLELATATPTSTQSAPVASAAACDSGALRSWLTQQQNALQTSANLFTSGVTRDPNDVINDLIRQLSTVESRPRPACADAAMNWTYYVFTTWIQAAVCRVEPTVACQRTASLRAKTYLDHVDSFYAPLLEQASLKASDLADLSADDFAAGEVIVPTPTATPTLTPTATTPHKGPPRIQTPEAPTPNANRGNDGIVANGPEARAIRGAISSSLMGSRVQGVLVIDASDYDELRGAVSGRGVIVAMNVSAAQQAAYTTDSILLMETVASAVQNQQLDLNFLIIITYDPATDTFSKASMVSINDVFDYQLGRITRQQLLDAIKIIDDNQLPQV